MFAGSQVWLKKLVLGERAGGKQEGDRQRLVERLARVHGRDAAAVIARVANQTGGLAAGTGCFLSR
jgi:hypothetical protein